MKLEVDLPTKYPIASVSLEPMPGWTSTTETTTLAKPITTVKSSPEPARPAPTLTLTKATSGP